jgi:uncharacterized membrane protein
MRSSCRVTLRFWLNDDFMKQAARTLQSGNAALFLLICKMTTDKVLAALHGAGGTVLGSTLYETEEIRWQTTLPDARGASTGAAG